MTPALHLEIETEILRSHINGYFLNFFVDQMCEMYD